METWEESQRNLDLFRLVNREHGACSDASRGAAMAVEVDSQGRVCEFRIPEGVCIACKNMVVAGARNQLEYGMK